MVLPQRTGILIVGAGPAGLACAISLVHHGHKDLTIIDSNVSGENTSRAIMVHAATLEALDAVGCAEPLIRCGIKAKGNKLWQGSRLIEQADFSALAPYTRFPFVLVVQQFITERVLAENLASRGIHILRPHKVVGMKLHAEDSRITEVLFEDNQIIQARCVIGADGVHSVVRRICGVTFADPDGEDGHLRDPLVVADVVLSPPSPFPLDAVTFNFPGKSMFLTFPLAPSTAFSDGPAYRIASGIPSHISVAEQPSLSHLQTMVDMYAPVIAKPAPTITRIIWTSIFRPRSAVAETCLANLYGGAPIPLIGDAAHVHPPTGGQGMNLGLRDALSLASPLVTYFHTRSEDALRIWAATRHAHALTVIHLAKRMLRLTTLPNQITWVLGCVPVNLAVFRDAFLAVAVKFRWVRMMMAWQLSGLNMR